MANRNDDVERALTILRAADFPVERIRILPASPAAKGPRTESEIDRAALLEASCAALKDGQPRTARDLSDLVQGQFEHEVTKRDVNSVLSNEGKDRVAYDRDTYTYRLRD